MISFNPSISDDEALWLEEEVLSLVESKQELEVEEQSSFLSSPTHHGFRGFTHSEMDSGRRDETL